MGSESCSRCILFTSSYEQLNFNLFIYLFTFVAYHTSILCVEFRTPNIDMDRIGSYRVNFLQKQKQ